MENQQNFKACADVKKILLTYCKKRVFSACSMAVKLPHEKKTMITTIRCHETGTSASVKNDGYPFFDLASLTKPLVTLLSVLILIDERKLLWTDPADRLLSRFGTWKKKSFTIENLLSHTSGLPAHEKFWREKDFFNKNDKKQILIDKIMSVSSKYRPNATHLYSDLGYIILGYIVEEISGITLDKFWNEHIAKKIGVEKEINFPENLNGSEIEYIPTGYCPMNNQFLLGIVHDDNCRMMGGVCGHAGLFGTINGVLKICQEILKLHQGKKSCLPVKRETLLKATSRKGNSEWTCGFNLPSVKNSSGGRLLSPDSIGHLGFTGTSFWIDTDKDMITVILTNRVYMGEDLSGIRKMRPEIHNFIADIVDKRRPPHDNNRL